MKSEQDEKSIINSHSQMYVVEAAKEKKKKRSGGK